MIEIEGIIQTHPLFVLIEPGASLSYINPQIVEKCGLKSEKFHHPWLVQLATATQRRVTCVIKQGVVNLNGYLTERNLNILPLGSYDLLVVIECLKQHKVFINFLEKIVSCVDSQGNLFLLKGKRKEISLRKITAL